MKFQHLKKKIWISISPVFFFCVPILLFYSFISVWLLQHWRSVYTHWMLVDQFEEREVQVIAAELGSALGLLLSLSLSHTHNTV